MTTLTFNEMATEIADLLKPPVVRFDGTSFTFHVDGNVMYELDARDAGDALRWIEHVGPKTWVTKEHLIQFARLAASHYGARYR